MRITSGFLKNRRFHAPHPEVRPTKEQVREAIFSSLGGSCAGKHVLDLFAGSGSLGLEAWSRGAESVTFVERSGAVLRTLQETVRRLDADELGPVRCIKADAIDYLTRAREQFDLVLADPPYDLPDAFPRTIEALSRHSVLTPGGILVYEMRMKKGDIELPAGWTLRRDKRYGRTRVLFLTLDQEPS